MGRFYLQMVPSDVPGCRDHGSSAQYADPCAAFRNHCNASRPDGFPVPEQDEETKPDRYAQHPQYSDAERRHRDRYLTDADLHCLRAVSLSLRLHHSLWFRNRPGRPYHVQHSVHGHVDSAKGFSDQSEHLRGRAGPRGKSVPGVPEGCLSGHPARYSFRVPARLYAVTR